MAADPTIPRAFESLALRNRLLPNPWPLARTAHRWLQRAKRHEAMVDGHRVVWLERGKPAPDRPTVVLLHGLAAMKENWAAWLAVLPGDWHVVAPDLPAFGESDYWPGASYRYRDQAERMAAWLPLAAPGPVHLVGSSMGGAIATLMARNANQPASQNPDSRVHSLTVLNSAGIPAHKDVALDGLHKIDRSVLIPRDWKAVMRMFSQVGSGTPNPMALAMTGMLGVDMLQRAGQNNHVCNDMEADPYAPVSALDKNTGPLLVIWGDRDRITPPGCVDYYRRATPHAEIQVLHKVGHLPMIECPQYSARLLTDFIERHHS